MSDKTAQDEQQPIVLPLTITVVRQRKGVTQYAIGRALGIPQSTLSLIERGLQEPTDDQLDKIAHYLGIPKKSKKAVDRSDLLLSWDDVLKAGKEL